VWVGHLRTQGFTVRVENLTNLRPIKAKHGIPADLEACHTALEVELVDIYRLRRLLELAPPKPTATTAAPGKVVPLGRFLRPAEQFAIQFTAVPKNPKGDKEA